ncbi:unnamed protein product [Medioppia subpectinata]|uniref:Choline/carnitine acyltransferase domain-containing protein n=1 Tax=Medioppia subpectinata TaxID=1979941 RepID=A0A7R9KFL9_9ACAR|nr:unnamed protein product [Medioppia subpectinata]CAG2101439.1 unnamed protein product [Medioppia subpectinata]
MAELSDAFKSTSNRTFENEDKLPSLPVPQLRSTLGHYLETVRPVVTDEEYEKTEAIVRNFEYGVAIHLQQKLVKRSEERKNWLEEWWEDVAYLRQRHPLIPFSNMTGSQPNIHFWPIQTGTRIERLALIISFRLQFWQLIRKEQLQPVIHKPMEPLAMNQFRRLFNTCRLPGQTKDLLLTCFKTESEGPTAPTNLIVLYRGYVFSFDLTLNDNLLNAYEIDHQLRYIEDWCQRQLNAGPGVGALTTTDRTKWALNREYLIQLNSKNKKTLDTIELSMFCVTLDDNQPVTQDQIIREALLGDCCENRWADKSYSSIAYINGNFGDNSEHTSFDAMVVAIKVQYIQMSINECQGVYIGSKTMRALPEPVLLHFKLDAKLCEEIAIAKFNHINRCKTLEITFKVFAEYGRSVSAKHRIHPEAYIQMAIQLAYYRTHGKAAPTYCTAGTRRFYHGRTETWRSCVAENVAFAKAVTDGTNNESQLYAMMIKAGEKLRQTMVNACNGRGCDRHLLGLYLTAVENGMEVPELYADTSYTRSGGNDNFVLSTSCVGYGNICRCVPPMVENGYSFFYGIEPHQYSFTISSYKSCGETSAQLLQHNLHSALIQMRHILDSQKYQS